MAEGVRAMGWYRVVDVSRDTTGGEVPSQPIPVWVTYAEDVPNLGKCIARALGQNDVDALAQAIEIHSAIAARRRFQRSSAFSFTRRKAAWRESRRELTPASANT